MERFLAHPKEEKESGLIQHSTTVAVKARELSATVGLENTAFYAGLLHDIGKLNPYYQILFSTNMENRRSRETQLREQYLRGHSAFSALASLQLLARSEISEEEKEQVLLAIAGHHSRLRQMHKIMGNFETDGGYNPKFTRSFHEMTHNMVQFAIECKSNEDLRALCWTNMTGNASIPNYDPYLASSSDPLKEYLEFCLIFSALLQADRGSFFTWQTPSFDLQLDTDVLVRPSRLADLRSEFQRDVLSTNPFSERVMVLEAPTGIGKTKILLDLIRKLTSSGDYERVFYFSPLLALTDDFENKLYDAKGRSVIRTEDVDSVLTYNHVYVGSLERKLLDELEIDDVAEDYYKTQEYFESETFNQKLVITTTQRLLHVLYSNSVSNKIKLLSLKNSILVLDEVQTIPKFLLPNFISTISHIAEMMNSKILLVSATVPNQIKNTLSRMNCSQDITREYMRRTVKNIQYLDNFKIELEASKFRKNERILMIANTRRKALHLFDSLSKLYDHAIYLSSGITKRNRRALFTQLRGAEPALVVSTQVMEAGVDVSFAKLYREVSPLDSVIQAMGRLNREAESSEPATMIVFKPPNADWKPYSELEYDESLEILREVTNSQELYDRLPEYYAKIDEKNLKNRNLARELEDKIRKLEFDEVWDFIFKNVLSEDSRGSVLIPSTDEWTEVKEYYSRKGGKPRIGRRNPYAELMAELPNTPRELKIGDLFDQDLLKNDVLLPRRECINRLYDETTGLDALMRQN